MSAPLPVPVSELSVASLRAILSGPELHPDAVMLEVCCELAWRGDSLDFERAIQVSKAIRAQQKAKAGTRLAGFDRLAKAALAVAQALRAALHRSLPH